MEDSRTPPLSRRVPGATNWPKPPARATPPVLPDHVIDRLRLRTKPTPEAPREPLPVRVLWQEPSDSASSPEVEAGEVTEPIPVIPPATLPQRVPGSHGPISSPGRTRQIKTPKRPVRADLLPPRQVRADPLPRRPTQADPLPPDAMTSAVDAGSTTEPIPLIAAASAAVSASPDIDEIAVEAGPPAPAVSAAARPAGLDRQTNRPARTVRRWRKLEKWLAGVPAAPELAGPTMLRPLFAESSTLEEMLASVRAQAEDQSVRAGRLRMIAIGFAVMVILIILAVVFAM